MHYAPDHFGQENQENHYCDLEHREYHAAACCVCFHVENQGQYAGDNQYRAEDENNLREQRQVGFVSFIVAVHT